MAISADSREARRPAIILGSAQGVTARIGPSVGRAAARLGERALAWVQSPEFADVVVPILGIRVIIIMLGPIMIALLGLGQADGWLNRWNVWDAPHLLEIAEFGYDPSRDPARVVLFPLTPAFIRLGSSIMAPLHAGMVLSLVASVLAGVALYRLVLLDGPRPVARGAVLAMNLFPTAYCLIPPYTEALFAAFSIAAFLQARRGRWAAAGISGLLAALTRIQGAFIFPALLLEYWLLRRRLDRGALWLLLILGGPLVYLGINALAYGEPLFFLDVQRRIFHVEAIAPWLAVKRLVDSLLAEAHDVRWVTVFLAPAAAFAILALGTVWSLLSRRSRPSFAVFNALQLISFATLSWPISVPRYLMGAFPLFIALGGLARRPVIGLSLLALSTFLLGMFMTRFLTFQWAF